MLQKSGSDRQPLSRIKGNSPRVSFPLGNHAGDNPYELDSYRQLKPSSGCTCTILMTRRFLQLPMTLVLTTVLRFRKFEAAPLPTFSLSVPHRHHHPISTFTIIPPLSPPSPSSAQHRQSFVSVTTKTPPGKTVISGTNTRTLQTVMGGLAKFNSALLDVEHISRFSIFKSRSEGVMPFVPQPHSALSATTKVPARETTTDPRAVFPVYPLQK